MDSVPDKAAESSEVKSKDRPTNRVRPSALSSRHESIEAFFAEYAAEAEEQREREERQKKKREKRSMKRRVFDFVITVVIGVVLALLLTQFVIQRNTVIGSSMVPTLSDQDEVFVEKISRLFENGLKRGNIVTADTDETTANGEGMIIIKRVVGLPGERVTIKNGDVYINGVLLDEPYLAEGVRTAPHHEKYADVTLLKNEYYLLGDNRTNSRDSRDIGPVTRDEIAGRLILRFYPLSKFGVP
ncbi:MAG TPA: signal peptidase I [Bacillota bacterium]|jgi:signal peptidase I|nr:signal peptidase I [Bacillota bacterium]HQC48945.1 signal peptidase I [Bacillota bacterium]